jgi:hypothetical protein
LRKGHRGRRISWAPHLNARLTCGCMPPNMARLHDWADHLALPHPREAGRWRDGRGLQGRGHHARRFVALKFLPDEVSKDPFNQPACWESAISKKSYSTSLFLPTIRITSLTRRSPGSENRRTNRRRLPLDSQISPCLVRWHVNGGSYVKA